MHLKVFCCKACEVKLPYNVVLSFFFLVILLSMLFFVAWVLQDWSKIASWNCWVDSFSFFLFLVDLSLWHDVSHYILLWVPLMVGLGAWTAPLLGFLCKICNSFRGFCKREEDMKKKKKKKEIVAPSMFLEKWGRWEDERGREKMVFSFFFWLTCQVRIGWHKTHLLHQLLTQFNLFYEIFIDTLPLYINL